MPGSRSESIGIANALVSGPSSGAGPAGGLAALLERSAAVDLYRLVVAKMREGKLSLVRE